MSVADFFVRVLYTKVYGIQSIQTILILSELKYDEDGKFSYTEVRSAQIPTAYSERNKWIKVFETLCYLFIEMTDQENSYKLIEDQEHGIAMVSHEETIRAKFDASAVNPQMLQLAKGEHRMWYKLFEPHFLFENIPNIQKTINYLF